MKKREQGRKGMEKEGKRKEKKGKDWGKKPVLLRALWIWQAAFNEDLWISTYWTSGGLKKQKQLIIKEQNTKELRK